MYIQYRAMIDCTFQMACILPQPRLSSALSPQPNPTQPLFAFRLDCILQLSRDNTHRGTGTGQGPHTDYTRTQHTTTSDRDREQGLFCSLERLSTLLLRSISATPNYISSTTFRKTSPIGGRRGSRETPLYCTSMYLHTSLLI
jgi:hypothetical protein